MKYRKYSISVIGSAVIACSFLAFSAFAADYAVKVTLHGDDSYPPYSFLNKGKPDGIYYKVLRLAAQRIQGYDVSIELSPYKRLLRSAEQGAVFAVFPPYYRPRIRPYFSEYSVPIYTEKVVAYCGRNVLESPRPHWPEDYYGLTVGNNDGFMVGGNAFSLAVKQGKLFMESAKGTDLNVRKLLAHRVDCYINDRASILWSLKRLGEDKNIPYVREVAEGAVIMEEKAYVAFSGRFKASYRRDFIDKLNSVLESMRKNGEIDRIVHEFLN